MRVSTFAALISAIPVALSTPPQLPPISNTSALPVHFGVIVYPGFVFLDAFTVVDVISTLSLPKSTFFHETDWKSI
jgi:hypothetical protein